MRGDSDQQERKGRQALAKIPHGGLAKSPYDGSLSRGDVSVRPTLPSLPPVIGRYELVRVLGQGAMGRVLLARDPVLNRDVAIKILRNDLGLSPEVSEALLARMRHEAQAAACVAHPNLVTLYDMGEDPVVGLFLVFEYVHGLNLKERLRSGRLPPLQAARLARELGGAMTMAHRAGVVHRDVKPENIMLSPTGAKLADFGIAKIPDSTLTRTGALVGTPAYCAPEALATGAFSAESDQFSLAASLYEALSAERAFPGEDALGVATKIATEDPKSIARRHGLPDEVDAILWRGMRKDPAQRFASAVEFGELLAVALESTFRTRPNQGSAPALSFHATSSSEELAVRAGPDQLRRIVGGITLALGGILVGYAASQGAPFWGVSMFGVAMPSASVPVLDSIVLPKVAVVTTATAPSRPRYVPPSASSLIPAASGSASPAGSARDARDAGVDALADALPLRADVPALVPSGASSSPLLLP